jgi:hypothetical protein
MPRQNQPPTAPPVSLVDQDFHGRPDVACAQAARMFVGGIEQRTGVSIWNRGLGDVVEALIVENGIPSEPVSAVDLARKMGILKPNPPKSKNARGRK